MSCFMGYNPLVAKEVKITTWIKEFDGESPVYPSFPNDGDCFVVFATDEDALTHNALSKKTYTNGDWADAEGGGGGFDIPTFTLDSEVWSCDMTYAEAKASYVATADDDGSGLAYRIMTNTLGGKMWAFDVLLSGGDLSYFDVPETVNEGLAVLAENGDPLTLFADDGNFYGVNL